jgi:hypothetical protein
MSANPAALKKIGFDIEVTIRSTMKARYTDVVQHPSQELMVFSYGQGYCVVKTRYIEFRFLCKKWITTNSKTTALARSLSKSNLARRIASLPNLSTFAPPESVRMESILLQQEMIKRLEFGIPRTGNNKVRDQF